MDNVFELVIFILFIGLSLLGSLNKDKKKKQQEKNAKIPTKRNNDVVFEDIFIQREEYKKPSSYDESSVDTYDSESWNPEQEYKSPVEQKPRKKKDYSSQIEQYSQKIVELDIKKDEISRVNYDIHESSEKTTISGNNTVQQIIKNPASLKDYILMSEILGKPKALRR